MSVKRALLTAVLCLGLIFGIFQGASAQTGNVCRILPRGEDLTFSNSDCSSYWAGDGWIALSPGQVKEAVKASSVTASFYGDNVDFAVTPPGSSNVWGPILSLDDDFIGAKCPTGLLYRSQFIWNLGQLAPGTYTLKYLWTVSHPLYDGTVSCTDDQTGQRLPNIRYAGTLNDTETTVTITP
jgi:hypothetical protein